MPGQDRNKAGSIGDVKFKMPSDSQVEIPAKQFLIQI